MTDQVENPNGALVDIPPTPAPRPKVNTAGWSLEAYVAYSEAIRVADQAFGEERDRRYKEVNIEKEKALKIKETADLAALGLAREIQDYKDQKANGLREIMQTERGDFATRDAVAALSDKFDVAHAPVLAYIESTKGRGVGANATIAWILASIGGLGVATSLIIQLSH